MDAQVKHLLGLSHSLGGQQDYGLEKEVHGSIQLVKGAWNRHFGTDDNVSTHSTSQIYWIVVTHTSVKKHLVVSPDCPEIERNGHRGAQGGSNVAAGPVLGRHIIEIRCDAGERDGQVRKTDAVLISDAYRTEHIADIQAVKITVRHSKPHPVEGCLSLVGGIVSGLLRHLVQSPLLPCTFLRVFIVIVERHPYKEFLAVFPQFICDICIRNLVRHHYRPLDVADERIELVVLVTHRIKAADETAHTGARDHIHGNTKVLYHLYHTEVGESASSAAGKYQAYGGTILAYGIHTRPYFGECNGVSLGRRARQNLSDCAEGECTGKTNGKKKFFHR